MRKTLLLLSLTFFLLSSKAQITLDHTFSYDSGHNLEKSRNYVEYVIINNQISFIIRTEDYETRIYLYKFYNPDFSLRGSFEIDYNIYSGVNISCFSQKLFNDDDLVEFLIKYRDSDELYYIAIWNENGEIVRKFDNVAWYSYPKVVQYQNQAKLIIHYLDKAEIYSLPGTIPNNIIESTGKSVAILPPYPNPSYSFVNLPYKLETGQTSVMSIYNINGQLIERKRIDAFFDVIKLNVENYKSGVYIYEYNGILNKFIVNK